MVSSLLKTIQISGSNAATFLQGLATCDVSALDQNPLFAACCNQKGRIVANFWIWRKGGDFYLQLPELMAIPLLNHLKTYVFRSQVSFTLIDASLPSTPEQEPIWILPETTEQFTPQMIGLEKQDGVSFTKGCYLGQEIIARTQHLGKLKRHLYQFTLEKEVDAAIGDTVENSEGEKMGTVVAVKGQQIFAVMEDRAVHEALTVNQIPLQIQNQ